MRSFDVFIGNFCLSVVAVKFLGFFAFKFDNKFFFFFFFVELQWLQVCECSDEATSMRDFLLPASGYCEWR